MHVQMIDGLTGFGARVRHEPVASRREAVLVGKASCNEQDVTEKSAVLLPGVVHRLQVLARHDEKVHRSLRVDVLERDDALVLVDDGGVRLAGRDPAEDAVAQRILSTEAPRAWSFDSIGS
jgi:hypothetical protein